MPQKVNGYGVWVDSQTGKVTQEMDTVKCVHCQRNVFVKPGTVMTVYLIPDRLKVGLFNEEPGAWCRNCDGPVCLTCHEHGNCDRGSAHFMRAIEKSEAQTAFRDALAREGRYTKGDPL